MSTVFDARLTDPETSREAAASRSAAHVQSDIVRLLSGWGPMTDQQISTQYNRGVSAGISPRVTDQRLRTVRAELVTQGRVEHTGEYGMTPTKRRTRIWRLVEPKKP